MNHGFFRVASATPKIKIGDCDYNALQINSLIDDLYAKHAQIVVFPDTCITGSTAGDLFWQESLVDSAFDKLKAIAEHTEGKEVVAIVGLPICFEEQLYDCAAVIYNGEIVGLIPKTHISDADANETRYFKSGKYVEGEYEGIPFGANLIFDFDRVPGLKLGVELGGDLWVPNPPSTALSIAGATVIANLSANREIVGRKIYRKSLVCTQSERAKVAYIYADAGEGESTTDFVFSAHNMIYECGRKLAEANRFKNEAVYADIDLERVVAKRRELCRKVDVYFDANHIDVDLKPMNYAVEREIQMSPFVPRDKKKRMHACNEAIEIQVAGLKQRLEAIGCKHAIIGVSGGLDSTLAMIVTAEAFDQLGIPRANIHAYTLPGYGTSDRTHNNAGGLAKTLGCSFKEINIEKAVDQHFEQIGHDKNNKNSTYENAQARERTFLLMDLANDLGGIVVGTGDMSELALGWATYNGDHMSMYGVNASVPKTMIRFIVKYYADASDNDKLKKILYDVLDTPVSPELLPSDDGMISQRTEELVGPYLLHDFFLYYMLTYGYTPGKIAFLAEKAFEGKYDRRKIVECLKIFYKRFFESQFKRSCSPDGPKVTNLSLSPRGGLTLPSDADVRAWLDAVNDIE